MFLRDRVDQGKALLWQFDQSDQKLFFSSQNYQTKECSKDFKLQIDAFAFVFKAERANNSLGSLNIKTRSHLNKRQPADILNASEVVKLVR